MIAQILELFKTPSSFRNDPVNWAYSQIGHGYLGFAVTTLIVWFVYRVSGQYPDETTVAIGVFIGYLVWWELDVQGWQGWDTLEDSLFVGVGASLFIFIDMSIVIDRLGAWVVLTGLAIMSGICRRLPNLH